MSLGKILPSLLGATVENSLSLVSVNVDFTLIKTTAPAEYKPVGQALSEHRRLDAEYGNAHRTARKLGGLFEQITPDTPELLKAYGVRVCDILQKPGINPTGSAADGPFREYVGADCTSLWAAATSGISALNVHLLASMLARAWDHKTATAIWVELVESRQAEILNNLGQTHNISMTSVAAARQNFLRNELAEWDASARAWLARADQGQAKQRDQYLLIVKNVSLTTGNNRLPYSNVIAAWTHAMVTLEKHLQGISQQISDGGVLYAISAWHIFPDLAYFGNGVKHIRFSDPVFSRPATMTLGLNEIAASPGNSGPHWSLALSHLRFYGDPVPVESQEDRTRASVAQLQVIVLGSVLESWQVPLNERLDAIKWINTLWTYLEVTCPFEQAAMPLSIYTSWLAPLAKAAKYVLSSNSNVRAVCEDYLSHGERWASRFLLDSDQVLRPYFGLCNPLIMAALEESLDVDAGIEYLRQLAKRIGLKDDEAIICYSDLRGGKSYHEYCTAVPHSDPIGGEAHARWIKIRDVEEDSQHLGLTKPKAPHKPREIDLEFRMDMLRRRGEQCFNLVGDSLSDRPIFTSDLSGKQKKTTLLVWDDAAPLFCTMGDALHMWPNETGNPKQCSCLTPQKSAAPTESYRRPMFKLYKSTKSVEQRTNLDLYIRAELHLPMSVAAYDRRVTQVVHQSMPPLAGAEWLRSSHPSPTRVWDYIQCYAKTMPGLLLPELVSTPKGLGWERSHGWAVNLISNNIMPEPPIPWFISLELLGVIEEIYGGLHGATISLGVFEYPLLEAHWTSLPSPPHGHAGARGATQIRGTGHMLAHMNRERSLACIAMMQTGASNIDPSDLSDVMAMSSDNSIFVAASLLTDPHEDVQPRYIRHIIGNIGYPGLNLMTTPPGQLRISRPKNEVQVSSNSSRHSWMREDKFSRSSLHLSFTGKRFPLVMTDEDTIDQEVFHLQSVVSLWDNGKHIADLDMLRLEKEGVTRVNINCQCVEIQKEPRGMEVRMLDSWRDILKPPQRIGVMRAHQNWCARLAAVALCLQEEKGHAVAVLGPEALCWRCLRNVFLEPEPHMPELLID